MSSLELVGLAALIGYDPADDDCARIEVERDELAADLERVEAELQDERTARLMVDDELARVYDAIADHERAVTNKSWGTSAKQADETLWRLLDER